MNIRYWGCCLLCALVSVGLLAGPGFGQPPGKRGGKGFDKSGQALERAEEKRGEFGEKFQENRERLRERKNAPKGKALGHQKQKRGKGFFKSRKGDGDRSRDQERVRERIQSGQESLKKGMKSGQQEGLAGAKQVQEAPKPTLGNAQAPTVRGGPLDAVEPAPTEVPKRKSGGFFGGFGR